jgi:hypothetical protein
MQLILGTTAGTPSERILQAVSRKAGWCFWLPCCCRWSFQSSFEVFGQGSEQILVIQGFRFVDWLYSSSRRARSAIQEMSNCLSIIRWFLLLFWGRDHNFWMLPFGNFRVKPKVRPAQCRADIWFFSGYSVRFPVSICFFFHPWWSGIRSSDLPRWHREVYNFPQGFIVPTLETAQKL